jgi:hypothetical protein
LEGVNRAEVLTWYQLPADMRGMYSCILGAHAFDAPESFIVGGIQTDGYTRLIVTSPILNPQVREYGAMTLTDMRVLVGFSSMCTITDWRLERQTDAQWRVSFWAANTGEHADHIIRNDSQRPTQLWTEQGAGTVFALLKNADEVIATVYDERGVQPSNTFRLAPPKRVRTAPAVQHSTNAAFEGVGTLIGVDVPDSLSSNESPIITLVWRADATPPMAYTVFVHLLDEQGNIIAQSDAQPAGNTYPTTNWIPGDYITDQHTLTWQDTSYRGRVSLRIGMYDANTMQRVALTDGSEYTIISDISQVQ